METLVKLLSLVGQAVLTIVSSLDEMVTGSPIATSINSMAGRDIKTRLLASRSEICFSSSVEDKFKLHHQT